MYWDSDEFIGVEGFKKTIPKQRFFTLSKYIHLMDPATKDEADLLCKVRPLINRLEEKCSDDIIEQTPNHVVFTLSSTAQTKESKRHSGLLRRQTCQQINAEDQTATSTIYGRFHPRIQKL